MARSLRCLELDVEGADDDPLPQHAITLIQSAPSLDELAIIRSRGAPTPDWRSNLLISPLGIVMSWRADRVRTERRTDSH